MALEPTAKVKELLDAADEKLQAAGDVRHKPQLAEICSKEALSLAEEAHDLSRCRMDQAGTWASTHLITRAKLQLGDRTNALKMAQQSLQEADDATNLQGAAVMLIAEAECLAAHRNFRGAAESAKDGVDRAQRLAMRSLECYGLYAVLFHCFMTQGEVEMAQLAAERAFDCTRAMDRKSKAKHCLAVAQTLKVTSLSSAESCAREALYAFRAEGDADGEAAAQASLAQALLLRGAYQEALRPARAALEQKTTRGLEVCVHALLGCGQIEEAKKLTQAKLDLFQNHGDRSGAAFVTVLLAAAVAAEGDVARALSMLEEALSSKLDSLQTYAKASLQASKLLLDKGMLDECLARAQEALLAFRPMPDWCGEQEANAVISEVYSRRNEPHLAPNRPQAVRLAQDMASSIQSRNASAFQTAAAQLDRLALSHPPLSKQEHQHIFEEAGRRDKSMNDFIRANAPAKHGSKAPVGAGQSFTPVIKEQFYWGFRAGGIGYGPRFRGVDAALGLTSQAQGVDDEAHAYAVYRLQDDADEWEKGYRAHPSILDSALQSGSAIRNT
ncbi:unnamed protein product [Effrenium voratum]|uniref:PKS/mFAS DH domain-containing protein n=1 Tax=Effrenium voratum TaxID=2562239 RepID=A0AA36J902_9DINO|nr:unnamed protein product [Effrenium voratum]CAJ1423740.1 unnamed protein product [Effrenium voratum]